jgi:hypothetical protein
MKRSLLVLLALVMSSAMLYSQAFEKGNHGINVGIGFGHTGYFGAGYKGFIPSIHGSYELGIVEVPMGAELTGVVSVGGVIGWATSRYSWTYWDDISYVYNTIIFGARGNYHFIFHDKLDTYAGVWLGYKIVNGQWKGDGQIPPNWDATSSNVAGGAYVGARWFFKPGFAAFAELGYVISVLNLGVTWKIPGNN